MNPPDDPVARGFQPWKDNHPRTQQVVSHYRPKTHYWKDRKTSPLSECAIDKIVWVLYKAYTYKRSPKKVWKECKDFLYTIVTKQMKHLNREQLKDMYGFHGVWGTQWNHESYADTYRKQKEYPVITASKDGYCICGVKIEEYFYCFNDSLKLTFRIGSVCSGHGASAIRQCYRCG